MIPEKCIEVPVFYTITQLRKPIPKCAIVVVYTYIGTLDINGIIFIFRPALTLFTVYTYILFNPRFSRALYKKVFIFFFPTTTAEYIHTYILAELKREGIISL
jgi:hypothetical protein